MKRRYAVITAILIISHFSLCAKSSEDEAFPQNSSSRQEKAAVTWHNFNEGIRQAREKRRPVVMDFYADWCGWCKKMEADVFSSAHVASKLNDNYICIRVYMDKDPNETIRYKNHTLSKQEFTAMLGIQ